MKKVFFIAISIFLIFASCKKDKDNIEPINNTADTNHVSSNGNYLIDFQTKIGNNSKKTTYTN